jgi:uncharacterized protein YdaU (DUF1376 family)
MSIKFYPRYIGDYQRDTGDLTLAQHGAYCLLLDHFYAQSATVPLNRVGLYRLLRAKTKWDKRAIDFVLEKFFTVENGMLRHKRAELELARISERGDRARANGAQSKGRPRKEPGGISNSSDSGAKNNPVGSMLARSGLAIHTHTNNKDSSSLELPYARAGDGQAEEKYLNSPPPNWTPPIPGETGWQTALRHEAHKKGLKPREGETWDAFAARCNAVGIARGARGCGVDQDHEEGKMQ